MQRKSTSTVENLGRETCNDLLVLTVLRLFSGTLEHSDLFGSFFFFPQSVETISPYLCFFFFLTFSCYNMISYLMYFQWAEINPAPTGC